MEQHHDEEHLAKAELARSLALATGGDQMVLLPVVVDLGKVIRTAERSHGRVYHEGDFRLCGYTDTESGPARFGNSPLSPMAAWGHSFSQAEQQLEHHSTLQQRFFPSWSGSNRGGLSPSLRSPYPQLEFL